MSLAPTVASRSEPSRAAACAGTKRKVTVYPSGVRVEVAPGEELVPWPDHLPVPMAVGVFELVPDSERPGSFRPMLRLYESWVRMKANITEELGLGITYASLRRLMVARFVASKQITPGQYSFCLQSYFQHQARVRADPEFWTGENLKRYMEAI